VTSFGCILPVFAVMLQWLSDMSEVLERALEEEDMEEVADIR
jgi:hypothetical protein